MSADFATVDGRLEAASSGDGPKGYLGDLLKFFAGEPGDGAAEEGRGRHSRADRLELEFDCCDVVAAEGVPFEFLSPGRGGRGGMVPTQASAPGGAGAVTGCYPGVMAGPRFSRREA